MSRSLGPPSAGRPEARGIWRSNLPRTHRGRAGVLIRSVCPSAGLMMRVGSSFSCGVPKCGATGERYMKNGLGDRWYLLTIARAIRPSTSVW
jgi:hypothetical protein